MNRELTKTEEIVCEYIKEGKTNQEIADEMGLKVKTVKFHLTHIFSKCGVRNRLQLAIKFHNGELE